MLRGLLGPDPAPLTHHGLHYTVEALEVRAGAARPAPPVLTGGGGERMLRLAAGMADIVSVNWNLGARVLGPAGMASGTVAATDHKLGWVREAAAGRCSELQLQCYVLAITERPLDAVEAWFRRVCCSEVDLADLVDSPHVLVGSMAAICDRLAEIRELLGFHLRVVLRRRLRRRRPVGPRDGGPLTDCEEAGYSRLNRRRALPPSTDAVSEGARPRPSTMATDRSSWSHPAKLLPSSTRSAPSALTR